MEVEVSVAAKERAERELMDGVFNDVSSQSQSSQRPAAKGAKAKAAIPQSNVADRRDRRKGAVKGKEKLAAAEPGFGDAPVNISKQKKALYDALVTIRAKSKDALMTKKDCFNNQLLDKFHATAEYLDLSETGEFIKYSAQLYALRVDTTYNDAMSTNCQLQPVNMSSPEKAGKKTKAELKLQQAAATQQLNLQKLQTEMDKERGGGIDSGKDEDEERLRNATPDVFMLASQEEAAGQPLPPPESDDEEDEEAARREAELTEEQRERIRDSKPLDTGLLTYTDNVMKDIIQAEFDRRARNMDRKCDSNPMLMDDERKFRMAPSAILTNEYYQIATARYKDLNAAGMLTNNVKITHNGRMMLMHKRMDKWRDHDVNDTTEPTEGFRKAIGGLVENAMRDLPTPMVLFDAEDIPDKKKALITGEELQELEMNTRNKILQGNDYGVSSAKDGEDEDIDEDEANRPSTMRPKEGLLLLPGDEEEEGPSTSSSLNRPSTPGTPAAETEGSAMSTSSTPKGGAKDQDDDEQAKEDMGVSTQTDKDGNTTVQPRKKKFKKAQLSSVFSEDEIKNGPQLSMEDCSASFFQTIVSDKIKQGANVTWKFGAASEELHADAETIAERTEHVEHTSMDMDLVHLDKIWTAKYYTHTFTKREVDDLKNLLRSQQVPVIEQQLKQQLEERLERGDRERKELLKEYNKELHKAKEKFEESLNGLKPDVAYRFFAEDVEWKNPSIPPDEASTLDEMDDGPIARLLEDKTETEKYQRTLEKMHHSQEESDEEEVEPDTGDRIQLEPIDDLIPPEFQGLEGGMDDDFDDNFGMSDANDDDEPATSSSNRPDFTAGDDRRQGERDDDHGMTDPLAVHEVLPSAEVRATGKADDSHWKGGQPEVVKKEKKEKKKKLKGPDGEIHRSFFDITPDMLDRKKVVGRFTQCMKSTELMKETDQLLMPVRINVQPQLDYDTSLFYKPFLLPNMLHTKYCYRHNTIVNPAEDDKDVVDLEPQDRRLSHYAAMLDSSMAEGMEGEDAFLSFMRLFKNFPEVATVKEMELEERVRSGEIAADEAAAEDIVDVGDILGGMEDDDDFGGGDDGGEGGGGGGMDAMMDDFGADFDDEDGVPTTTRDADVVSQKTEWSGASEAGPLVVVPAPGQSDGTAPSSSLHKSVAQSALGYAMRVDGSDSGNDEADAVAKVGDREYQLRLIKLDTVAMKTALSDVLTNPLMVAEKLDETLTHINRRIPTQQLAKDAHGKGKRAAPLQTVHEDEEMELAAERERDADTSAESSPPLPDVDIEATMMEVPDCMDVSRALFAPPKEITKTVKKMTFGGEANTSQTQAHTETEHINLIGHHTLKSTFTCLPARMPVQASTDVTVASTIAMILHLANENNLILEQEGQYDEGVGGDGNTTTTYGDWMNDFAVNCPGDDGDTTMTGVKHRITRGMEVLTQLSAEEDASDAEKRHKQTERVLAEMAEKQRKEKEREKRETEAAKRRADQPGASTSAAAAAHDETIDVLDLGDDADVFAVPSTSSRAAVSSAIKKGTPRKASDGEDSSPSKKRARTRRSSGTMDETILIDE